jgi:hypothetical protein
VWTVEKHPLLLIFFLVLYCFLSKNDRKTHFFWKTRARGARAGLVYYYIYKKSAHGYSNFEFFSVCLPLGHGRTTSCDVQTDLRQQTDTKLGPAVPLNQFLMDLEPLQFTARVITAAMNWRRADFLLFL